MERVVDRLAIIPLFHPPGEGYKIKRIDLISGQDKLMTWLISHLIIIFIIGKCWSLLALREI